MYIATILSVILGVAVVIYAVATCPDILNALSTVTKDSLGTDTCSTSRSCNNDEAKIDITCTYNTALTDNNIGNP